MSLITPFEVLKYSPAGFEYPTGSFCQIIPQVEQEFVRQCLDDELYNYLVSKLTPYPTGTGEYDPGNSYDSGDIVIRNGQLFVSDVNSNATDPLTPGSPWSDFERFTEAGANELWKGYLRFILALKVYMSSLIFTTYRGGSGGLVINSGGDGTGFRSANKSELITVNEHLVGQVERATANMLVWLKDNATAKGLPVPSCLTACATPGRRSRRWGWKI